MWLRLHDYFTTEFSHTTHLYVVLKKKVQEWPWDLVIASNWHASYTLLVWSQLTCDRLSTRMSALSPMNLFLLSASMKHLSSGCVSIPVSDMMVVETTHMNKTWFPYQIKLCFILTFQWSNIDLAHAKEVLHLWTAPPARSYISVQEMNSYTIMNDKVNFSLAELSQLGSLPL